MNYFKFEIRMKDKRVYGLNNVLNIIIFIMILTKKYIL